MSVVLLLGVAALLLSIIMTCAWALAIRTGNHGWADTFWTFGIGVVGAGVALVPLGEGQPAPRAMLVSALVAVWALRLGTHIARRTLAGTDDPRYAQLRRAWGADYHLQLWLFLQIQAGAGLVLVGAVFAAAQNPSPLGLGIVAGGLIAAIALVGEAVSDAQLRAFRSDPANAGKVCDVGLWSVSRHPNYFFEWLYWLAYVPIGLNLTGEYPFGLVTFAAPALMYALLAHVSGVPPLEAHMLRSRGDAFRDYQRRVRAFWPVPRS